ncbi:hypothetical protein [Streptomyces sp. NPDC059209]|uniref:hypothetical protein n=1 Tax=Streptomyces sp. NPDC059209 TaxID=3346769 RepID=UPI0036A59AD5
MYLEPDRAGHVIGDEGYSSKATRTWLRRLGTARTTPERCDQVRNRARRGRRGGRPARLRQTGPQAPHVVERCFSRLKQWHGIATGYDKTVQSLSSSRHPRIPPDVGVTL